MISTRALQRVAPSVVDGTVDVVTVVGVVVDGVVVAGAVIVVRGRGLVHLKSLHVRPG